MPSIGNYAICLPMALTKIVIHLTLPWGHVTWSMLRWGKNYYYQAADGR